MDQDCIISLLHQSVGMSVGGEFSSEDVSRIYCKVFHVPSNADEARSAMKKIAGGDNNWLCVGENVFDVLLEMEREREKKEQLYWDMQLLSVGNNTLYMMDMPDIIDPHGLSCQHQSTNPNTLKSAYHQSDSCTFDTGSSQGEGVLVGKNELYVSVGGARRLKKAARHCWARLVSEGVQSIAPSPWQGKIIGVQGQAWGCVSLSDVLLLLEVKYDVVTHLLYTEMLQEHHTQSVWKTLLPWQQHKEHEGLEALAEEVLLSGDMLRLAELPGAFRIYRARLGECFRSHLECREQFWSAISLLSELHTSRQQERDTLTVLGERLDRDSMRLLCLYIRLATLRAQREKMSYRALLAARQSWETWPHVSSPCRTEQAVLWLQGEEEEHKEDLIFESPWQSLLQLLVLTQEQERKNLVKLIRGVSLEDLQGADRTVPPKEESNTQSALRNGCIKRLRQIYTSPQTSIRAQSQMQAHMSSKPGLWSQHQMENCTLPLLTHLLELHEVQASALLPELMDKSVQHLQVLWDKYESEVEAPSYTNLLQLLMTDHPLTSDSIFAPTPNVTENSSTDQMITQSGCTGPAEAQINIDGPAKALTPELVTVQAAEGTGKQDVCTGCGAVMEALPYLEILCVSDATSEMLQSLPAEKRVQEEEEGNTTISPQNYEKQGSLITLAWSKPPDNDTDYEAESVDGVTEQSQDSESSEKTQAHSSDISSTAECTQYDETSGQTPDQKSRPTGHHETHSADQQRSTKKKLTLEKIQMLDQIQKEGKSDCDLHTHALVAETLQAAQPNLLVDLPHIKPRADELCSAMTSETAVVGRDGIDVETGPTETAELFHLITPESTKAEDQKYNLQVKAECDFAERKAMSELILTEKDRVRGPVSAMEREMTMRNLVDMQRKVEQKQQRDRERQLLRVQERLSIIQNRKAEEDLLGLKHTDRLKHLTQDLPREDKTQQKTVVKERLEQLKRERSYIMQSKRDRNTAGFKELLGPVALHSSVTDDGSD